MNLQLFTHKMSLNEYHLLLRLTASDRLNSDSPKACKSPFIVKVYTVVSLKSEIVLLMYLKHIVKHNMIFSGRKYFYKLFTSNAKKLR